MQVQRTSLTAPAPLLRPGADTPAARLRPLDEWAGSAEVQSLPAFFRMAVTKNPDGPYLGAKVGDAYQFQTYRQTEERVEQFAAALIQHGIEPGQRVATFADNCPDWRVVDFAVAYAGCVHAPLYNQLSDKNVEFILKDSQAQVLVVDSRARLDQVLKAELPDLKTIVVLDDIDLSEVQTDKQLVSMGSMLEQGRSALETVRPEMERRIGSLKAQDFGGMVYTSGSTGNPKGVLLSHGNWISDVEGVLKVINQDPKLKLSEVRVDDLYPSILPQGHVMGRVADYALTAEGGAIAYPAGLAAFKRDLKELKPTVMAVTPLFFQKIYAEAEKKAHRDDSPVIHPRLAGLGAGVAGSALGAVAGALVGSAAAGPALAWGLGLAGAALGGALADKAAGTAASKVTKSKLFDASVSQARTYFEQEATAPLPLRVKQWAAEKAVFSKVRAQVDAATGGRLRILMSGGAPLGGEVEALFRASGFNIAQGYGLSETAGASVMNDPARAQLGTVGQALPGVEVRLADNQEIQLRGPNIMSGGYLNQPEKTAESFTPDGFYKTGDTGKLVQRPIHNPWKVSGWAGAAGALVGAVAGGAAGHPVLGAAVAALTCAGVGAAVAVNQTEDYYAVTGRIKSQFKLPGGEYVTPEPIEEDLKGSPFIQEAVVVGARDRDLVGALIVPKFDNLKAWAAERALPTDPAALVANPEVQALLRQEALDRSASHASHERVRAVALLDHEFTVEADELTPSFKVKRSVVLEKYAAQIEGMF